MTRPTRARPLGLILFLTLGLAAWSVLRARATEPPEPAADAPASNARTAASSPPVTGTADTLSPYAAPPATEPAPPIPDEPALRNIMAVRREQGDLFQGTIFEELAPPMAEVDFLRALRKAALSHTSEATRPADRTPRPVHPFAHALPETSGPKEHDFVVQLRQTGRYLDHRAADLEDMGQYPEADRLRSLARQLRREARRAAEEAPGSRGASRL